MIALDSIERRLTDAYLLQAKYYEDALRILNEDAQGFELDAWANNLQSTLSKVAVIDERITPEKLAWEKSARSPDLELRTILEMLAARIRALTAAIDRRSQELLARKQCLLPVLDEFIRHRHMLHSYEQFGRPK
jgi:hypothetical protein